MNDKKKILLLADWYEPGYKAGGPIRSCVNFVHNMQEDYEVYVFTSDRDLGDSGPYEDIKSNEWLKAGSANIFYCSQDQPGWKTVREQLAILRPDFLYLNSMFSAKFTVFPLLIIRLCRLKTRIVLSPRGMLRESAIRIKSVKKKIFLKSFRWLGFHKDIHFLAADEIEVNDIRDHFGSATRMTMIPNFPAALPDITSILQKKEGEISLIYIARIHPIKNLDYLLKVLREVRATVRLTVVGSLEDKDFWLVCQEIIKDLPPNIAVDYEGEIRNHLLPAITARHHIFVLPTKGENFGHAIFEALALGKPVLISDQTPWRNLQLAGAGWDLPLDSPGQFGAAIEQAAAFNQDEYEKWCCSTRQYIQAYINRLDLKEEYQKLFS